MFVFIAVNFLVVPLAVFSHRIAGSFFDGPTVPGVEGGFNSTSVLLIIAIVGRPSHRGSSSSNSRTSWTSGSPPVGSATSGPTR